MGVAWKNPKGISSFSPALTDSPRRNRMKAGDRAMPGKSNKMAINPERVGSNEREC
jgi:hypothetical protein